MGPGETPEVGSAAITVGPAGQYRYYICETGEISAMPMVRIRPYASQVSPSRTVVTRCFTKRANGAWVERGETMKRGTRLLVGGDVDA